MSEFMKALKNAYDKIVIYEYRLEALEGRVTKLEDCCQNNKEKLAGLAGYLESIDQLIDLKAQAAVNNAIST